MKNQPVVNYYNSLQQPQVIKNITLQDWINLIQSSEFSQEIETIRDKNLTKDELDEYKKQFPAISPNFIFDDYKLDKNIIKSTGYIYIDIDQPSFDIGSISGKTAAYNKSFSNNGYAVYVRVENITPENFKNTYECICDDLGVTDVKDKRAVKHSQFNVLSFDTNAFYNDNPIIYSGVSASSITGDDSCPPMVSNIRERKTYTHDWGAKQTIRYDNLNEVDIASGERYVVNWEGISYIKCFIPIRKLSDKRKRFLLSYTTNLMYLNPWLNYEKALLVLKNVNGIAFTEPLPIERLQSTLASVMKQLKEGKLNPIYYHKKRKIIFQQTEKFFKDEKRDIALTEIAIMKTNRSLSKLETIITNWNFHLHGKITTRSIKQNFPISKKTVDKYYKHFKQQIEDKNQNQNTMKPENKLGIENLYSFTASTTHFKTVTYTVVVNSITNSKIEKRKQKILSGYNHTLTNEERNQLFDLLAISNPVIKNQVINVMIPMNKSPETIIRMMKSNLITT